MHQGLRTKRVLSEAAAVSTEGCSPWPLLAHLESNSNIKCSQMIRLVELAILSQNVKPSFSCKVVLKVKAAWDTRWIRG